MARATFAACIGWALACGGMTELLPDPEAVPDAVPAATFPTPPPAREVTLLALVPGDGTCDVVVQVVGADASLGEPTVLGTVPSACPAEAWQLAWDDADLLVAWPGTAARLAPATRTVTALPPAPERLGALSVTDEGVAACATLDVPVRVEGQELVAEVDGVEVRGPVGADAAATPVVVRTWTLVGEAWKVGATTPLAVPGDGAPCGLVAEVQGDRRRTVDVEDPGLAPASEAEAKALAGFGEGSWSVLRVGEAPLLAARLEGEQLVAPVAAVDAAGVFQAIVDGSGPVEVAWLGDRVALRRGDEPWKLWSGAAMVDLRAPSVPTLWPEGLSFEATAAAEPEPSHDAAPAPTPVAADPTPAASPEAPTPRPAGGFTPGRRPGQGVKAIHAGEGKSGKGKAKQGQGQ